MALRLHAIAALVVTASVSVGAATAAAQPFRMLAAFEQGPRHPDGRLLAVGDTLWYGVTGQGGRFGHGTVFALYRQPSGGWEQFTLHSFNGADGSAPARGLTLASNGFLYGITRAGGRNGQGTIFRIGLSGGLTTLHSFPSRATPQTNLRPEATLIQTTDGNLWGTVCRGLEEGSLEGNGRVFRMTPAGAVTTVVQFADATCASSLVQAPDGNVYGTTDRNLFRLTTAGALAAFESFTHVPNGDLIVGSDGNVYGTASHGLRTSPFGLNAGVIFGFSPSELRFTTYVIEHDEYPSGLVEGTPGVFYTTRSRGTFVRFETATGASTVVAEIDRRLVGERRFQLTRGADGLFYGLSAQGAPGELYGHERGKGTAFSFDVNGQAAQLHGFDREGPLLLAGALLEVGGALVGASCLGGAYDLGTIYRLDASGVTILHSFDGGRDFANGGCPTNLVADGAGNLFGMTLNGVIFRLAPDRTFTVLHRQGNSATRQVADSLTLASDGSLWGCWIDFESFVFRLAPDGAFTRFPIPASLGQAGSSVVEGADGNFYGAARTATSNLFRVTPAGQFSLVKALAGPQMVVDRLTRGSDGNLYGSAASFSTQTTGYTFRLTLAGALTNVHQFTVAEGYTPISGVVETPAGELAGVTVGLLGNSAAAGTVYAIGGAGALRTLHRFSGLDGANPYAPLLVGSDGALYGVTLFGGPGGNGVIFRIQP